MLGYCRRLAIPTPVCVIWQLSSKSLLPSRCMICSNLVALSNKLVCSLRSIKLLLNNFKEHLYTKP